jgi:hypothetical protein
MPSDVVGRVVDPDRPAAPELSSDQSPAAARHRAEPFTHQVREGDGVESSPDPHDQECADLPRQRPDVPRQLQQILAAGSVDDRGLPGRNAADRWVPTRRLASRHISPPCVIPL